MTRDMTGGKTRGRVLMIDHPVGQRDDRASAHLAERGFELEWCCPGDGDPLPAPDADFQAAVAFGGAENLSQDEAGKAYLREEIDWIERWLGTGRPFLGICLGAQLLARALGAPVRPHPEGRREIGYVEIEPTPAADGFLAGPMHFYQWHQEGFALPAGAELLATGRSFPNQAFRHGANAYGLQFHPEVTPVVMTRWLDEASHALAHPGAQPRENQLADAPRHGPPMNAWLETFLDRWLEGAG